MKYILKGDRQKLEKVVGKAVEDVFKDYNVTYIGDCIKTITPMGELYMNAKCYGEVFIECIEEASCLESINKERQITMSRDIFKNIHEERGFDSKEYFERLAEEYGKRRFS